MKAIDIYRAQYEVEKTWYEDEWTKYEWAASKIFNLTTYDGALDEQFVKTIIEVCKVILERRNFEYIEDEKNYVKYILVCQLLDQYHWIEWGTSIRGAWFDIDIYHDWETKQSMVRSRDILEELEYGEYDPEKKEHVDRTISNVSFTAENLKDLIMFMEEDTDSDKVELKNGYCPICNLTIEEQTKESKCICPKCGHHIALRREE